MDSQNGGIIEIGSVRIDATDENNASISFGATVIRAKLLFAAISGLLAFIFFLPIFRIPIGRLGTRWVNGATVLSGNATVLSGGNNRGVFSIIFILLLPILVILLFQFKEKIEGQIIFVKDNLFVIVTGSYIFSFIMLWVSRTVVRIEYGFMARGTPFFGFSVLIYFAVIGFSVLWAMSSKGIGFKIGGGNYMSNDPFQQSDVVTPPTSYIGKRRESIMTIVFTIITCGIYMYYWLYVTMEDINRASGEQKMNSTALLIGMICCAPVMWYVLYQIDKGIVSLSAESGTSYRENFILWLLLSLVAGVGMFVAMFQVSGALNEIWDRRAGVSRS